MSSKGKIKYYCDKCRVEAKEGEYFITFIDPNSEWWLQLFSNPIYCYKCSEIVKKENRNDKVLSNSQS